MMQRPNLFPMISLVIALFIASIFTSTVQADGPAGEIDLDFGGFGSFGRVVFDNFKAVDMAQQPDGKIVVIGQREGATYATIHRYTHTGRPDPTFDDDGVLDLPLDHRCYWLEGCAVAVQTDGKIVVAFSATGTKGKYNMVVARLHRNGVIDTSFGVSGMKAFDFFGEDDLPYDVAIQTDGKIVVVGTAHTDFDVVSTNPTEKQDRVMTVARLNADGTRDLSFAGFNGQGGVGVFVFQANENDDDTDTATARQVAIQPDGKIVIVGHAYVQSRMNDSDFAVVRLQPDGSPDTTFSGDGRVLINSGGFNYGYGLALYPDGKILVAGASGFNDLEIVKLKADGTLDRNFYLDGTFRHHINGKWTGLRSIAVRPNGKIVAVGRHSDPSTEGLLLLRLNANNSFDGSLFGDGIVDVYPGEGIGLIVQPDGKYLVLQKDQISRFMPYGSRDQQGVAMTDFATGNERAWAATLQPDGKILLAGSATQPNNSKKYMALARYMLDGTLDPTFGTAGKQYALFATEDGANDVIVHPNGTIIAAGYTKRANFDFALYLFSSFGSVYPAAQTSIDFGFGDDFAQEVLLQPDGKVVVVGFANRPALFDPDRTVFAVARLQADGTTLDPGFGQGGKVLTLVGNGTSARARAALLQPDGKIVVAGSHDGEVVVVRYLPDGTPDPDFGQGGIVKVTGGTIDGGGTLDHPMDTANAVGLLAQGNLVVAGQADNDFGLLILGPNGGNCTICGNISNASTYWLGFETGAVTSSSAYDLAVQPDGKIVLVGNAKGNGSPFVIARVRPKGSVAFRQGYELDPTFAGDGLAYAIPMPQENLARAVVLSGQSIIVAGHSKNQNNYDFTLARLNNDVVVNPPNPGPDPTKAGFTVSATTGSVPLTVNFTDNSTGAIDSWYWEFGDGATSTAQNPSHTYTTAGNYSVVLTVTGPGGEDTLAVGEFVTVTPSPNSGDYQIFLPLIER